MRVIIAHTQLLVVRVYRILQHACAGEFTLYSTKPCLLNQVYLNEEVEVKNLLQYARMMQ